MDITEKMIKNVMAPVLLIHICTTNQIYNTSSATYNGSLVYVGLNKTVHTTF